MKKVYQTIVDHGRGNCMQAAFASLFDKELADVPNFIELERLYKHEGKSAWIFLTEWLDEIGYEIIDWFYPENTLIESNTIAIQALLRYAPNINGCFFATVRSHKYWKDFGGTHAVIIDREGNCVHDPNPEYELYNYHPIINIPIIVKKEDVSKY